MEIQVLAFGIAKDILKSRSLKVDIPDNSTVSDLKMELVRRYPRFSKLTSFSIAVNADYVDDTRLLETNDEIVIIPPVSGG